MMFFSNVPPLCMATSVSDFNISTFIEKGFKSFSPKTLDNTCVLERRNHEK